MTLDRTKIKRDLAAADGEVRVMTVHGAKGLQAPIVILPDTTSAPKPIKPSLVSIMGAPAWIGAKDTDTDQSVLAREDLTKRTLLEHRRLLYVALTRAQDRLMVFGAWAGTKPKPNNDKPAGDGFRKGSWYALCAEAMAGILGELPLGDDERPVFCRFGMQPQTSSSTRDTIEAEEELPKWLTMRAPTAHTGIKVTAPSALIPGETPIMPPLSADRMDRLKRGRLIHALLERLPALPAPQRAAEGAAFLARDTSLSKAARTEMLSAAMGLLNDPAFAEVFAEGGRAEAPIIGTAPSLPANIIINGRVDRLVVTRDEVFIIDFKTDRPPPKRAKDVGRAYLAQMGAYATVLAEAYPSHQIRAALAWTDGPKLMELPADLLAEAISHSSVAV
jgi:ATP-dependent helicase/nuclease subunit A